MNGDGYITFPELVTFLQRRASNSNQTPAAADLPGHGLGEFVFVSPKGTINPPFERWESPREIHRGVEGSTDAVGVNRSDKSRLATTSFGPVYVREYTLRTLAGWSGSLYLDGSRIRLEEGKHSFDRPVSDISEIEFYLSTGLVSTSGAVSITFQKEGSKRGEIRNFVSNFKDAAEGVKECSAFVEAVKATMNSSPK